jgi:hypothetical protein
MSESALSTTVTEGARPRRIKALVWNLLFHVGRRPGILFPGQSMLGDRRIERGLAVLIWISLPFLLYLMRIHPGGYRDLLENYPEYFFFAAAAALAVVLVLFGGTWLAVNWAYREFQEKEKGEKKSLLRLAHRIWMTSVVSTFSITVILLAGSTFVSLAIQPPASSNAPAPSPVDMFSLMLRWGGYKGELCEFIAGFAYALIAAVLVNVGVIWFARRLQKRAPANQNADRREVESAEKETTLAAEVWRPDILRVAVLAYLGLLSGLYLTTVSSAWLWKLLGSS